MVFNEVAEKVIFHRLLKNAQVQGAREAFHLPFRQAILRSEAYPDVRRNKPAPCLTRGRMRGGVATNKERLLATPPRR
jgi:hypothetical protein